MSSFTLSGPVQLDFILDMPPALKLAWAAPCVLVEFLSLMLSSFSWWIPLLAQSSIIDYQPTWRARIQKT